MEKKKILYIEDEESLGRIVQGTLEHLGFQVFWKTDGRDSLELMEKLQPDICILDIMLPNIDGYSLCRTIKGLYPSVPIIFLTAKNETKDLIEGFEAGATDYLKKPFSIEELIARIKNQLRTGINNTDSTENKTKVKIGEFIFDQTRYELQSGSKGIRLSNRDMEILRLLYASRNRVISRRDLLLSVWGDDSYFNSRTLDVYIRKFRKYFSDDRSIQLITLKGEGYMFIIP